MSNVVPERTLGEIAEHVGGRVCGDPSLVIRAAATLRQAGPGDISFLVNRKYDRQLEKTKADAVIVGREIANAGTALVVVEDPYFAFTQALVLLYGHRQHKEVGISLRAAIAASARIGVNCHIHDFATVSDEARIGEGCVLYPGVYVGPGVWVGAGSVLYPNVVLYERCRIGDRVTIHANSTIGADGFGYATHHGVHHKIPQIGGVLIEDDVEIGSSCSVERGTLGDTIIGQGSKLGDLVTIGHGTRIGPHSLLVAQVGIAGSATLGHHCTIGGQAGIVGHITIGDHVTIGGQAGVINDLSDGQTVLGAPAVEADQARRAYALLPYLPQMRQEIRKLQRRLNQLAAAGKAESDGPAEHRVVE